MIAFRSTRILCALLLWSSCVTSSWAINRSTVQIAQLSGADWQAQQLTMQVDLNSPNPRAEINIGKLTVQGSPEPIRKLRIVCPMVELLAERFVCAQARVRGVFPYLGQQQFTAAVRYRRSNGSIDLDLQQLKFAQADTQLQVQLTDRGWQAQATLKQAELSMLLQVMQQAGVQLDLSGSGSADARVRIQGQQATPQRLEWQINADKITLSNTTGTLASDQLALSTQGQATALQGSWHIDAELNSSSGQAYAEPVFVDMGKHALSVKLQANWNGTTALQLQQLELQQQDIIQAQASGRLNLRKDNPAPELVVQISQLLFPGTFTTYLQPFLLDSVLKNLDSRGSLQGSAIIKDSWPTQVDAQLNNLRADTGNEQLMLEQVNGDLHWRDAIAADDKPSRSTLSWQSGSLLGLQLGSSSIPLEIWGSTLRFAEATRIPIFNGALAVDALRIRKLGTPQMAFLLDAEIEPINVAQISKAFGWPEFGGELSGKITKLRMEDGVVSLGSTLSANVFDGAVSISDMRLEGILTDWPRFSANIKLDNLDLQQVTQAFSFGRITGKLSGEINQLNLFNWEPASFDARFYTPANDRSKHRISQRAVQNIGSVAGNGGGVTAALQSGFLKFFDDFNYDQLGLSCKLDNGVCLMNGVAPAQGSAYYLVKGKGLPRIDVIGNSTRVDWPRLMAQLKAVTESAGPVVK